MYLLAKLRRILAQTCALGASGLGLCLAGPVAAQTWNGGTNSNWTTNGNWVGSSAPANNGTASVLFAGSTNTTVSVNGVAKNISSLGFAANASNFTLAGSNITLGSNLTSASANIQILNANIQLGSSQTWDISAGSVIVNGVLSTPWYMTFTKAGAGTLVLNSNNTIVGPTVVNAGILRLGHNGALGESNYGNEINSGATLELAGGLSIAESAFSLRGDGVGGNGVIRSLSGANSITSALTLNAASRIQVDSGSLALADTLAVNSNLTWAGAGNGTISSVIHGSGTIFKTGTGTLTFSGTQAISNGGGLTVETGVVELGRSAGINAWNGPMVVGLDGAAPGAATLRLTQNEQIANHLNVTVRESGVFDLNNREETLTKVTMTGGTIQTGTGVLKISDGAAVTTNASTTSATISGRLELSAYSGNFSVANGAAANDLVVSAAISSTSGGNNIAKSGDGTMVLSGGAANTFTGSFTISGGTVVLSKTGGVDAISGSSLIVNSGGTLLMTTDNQFAAGTGVTLAGGTFNLNGRTEGAASTPGLGSLTLSANSTFDLGASGNGLIAFSNSGAAAWTGDTLLTVTHWDGNLVGGGNDRIYFGSSASGLTEAQLAQIRFLDPAGLSAGLYNAQLLSTGELVPFVNVPEPGTWAAGAALAGLAFAWEIRRRKNRTKTDTAV